MCGEARSQQRCRTPQRTWRRLYFESSVCCCLALFAESWPTFTGSRLNLCLPLRLSTPSLLSASKFIGIPERSHTYVIIHTLQTKPYSCISESNFGSLIIVILHHIHVWEQWWGDWFFLSLKRILASLYRCSVSQRHENGTKKPTVETKRVHREDPASDKRGWCQGANSQDNIHRQISLLMCWNTIRLQKSMKQSSNIDPGAAREQLEGYYTEIVCKWGELSDWAFIFSGSSLHVQVLTVISINLFPTRYTDPVCLLRKSEWNMRNVRLWPCITDKCLRGSNITSIYAYT